MIVLCLKCLCNKQKKHMWKKYMEKLLNDENDWDGEVDCLRRWGSVVSFWKTMLQHLSKNYYTLKKSSWSYWCGE